MKLSLPHTRIDMRSLLFTKTALGIVAFLVCFASQSGLANPVEAGDVRVRVVDGRTGKPIPNPELYKTTRSIKFIWASAMGQEEIGDSSFFRGKPVFGDEEGFVFLPRKRSSYLYFCQVSAGDQKLGGMLEIGREGDAELEFELMPLFDLTVIVEDTAGYVMPGVGIGIRKEKHSYLNQEWVTDDEGQLTLFNASLFLPANLGTGEGSVFADGIPSAEEIPFSMSELPRVPLGLISPSSKEAVHLEIRAVNRDGELVADSDFAFELWSSDAPFGSGFPYFERTQDGVCKFKFVPRGEDFVLQERAQESGRPVDLKISTPLASEGQGRFMEVITIDVVVDSPQWVFRGRIVDQDSAPYCEQAFTGTFAHLWIGPQQTDAKGRFEIELDKGFDFQLKANRYLDIRLTDSAGARLAARTKGFVGDKEYGEHDLGDLKIPREALIVSGIVVDHTGLPIANAAVRAKLPIVDPRTGEVVLKPNGEPVFGSLDHDVITTGEDGVFEVRGASPGGEFRITAESPGCNQLEPIILASDGDTDIRITLVRAGTVTGTLLTEVGDPRLDWTVFLVPTGTSRSWTPTEWDQYHAGGYWGPDSDVRKSVGQEGSFTFERVLPGSYDLGVLATGETTPRAVIQGLQVDAGESCDDPRLAFLRPADKRVELRVRIKNRKLAPHMLNSPDVFQRDPSTGEFSLPLLMYPWHTNDGTASICVKELPVDLLFKHAGGRDIVLLGVTDSIAISLEEGIPLRITIPDSLRVQEGSKLEMVVTGGPYEEPEEDISRSPTTVRSLSGAYDLRVGSPGTYMVQFKLLVPTATYSTWSVWPVDFSFVCQVKDSSEVQHFALKLEQKSIDWAAR